MTAVPAPGSGYELNLAPAALAFVVALLGTGPFSLDVALRNLLGPAPASRNPSVSAGRTRPPD